MDQFKSRLIFALALLNIVGCKSSSGPAPEEQAPQAASGRSIDEMKAQWTTLRAKYVADCMSGSPDHIRANQQLCENERKDMAPLGNALAEAQIAAAKQHNP